MQLQTLSVKDLQLGMVVHSIAKQTGRLTVKHKGKIRHHRVIDQLLAGGVSQVIVEVSADTLQSANKPFRSDISDDAELCSVIALDIPRPHTAKNWQKTHKQGSFVSESKLDFPIIDKRFLTHTASKKNAAEQLVIDCKKLHKRISTTIENELQIDLNEAKSLVVQIHYSLTHNPEALLCLSMIKNDGSYLANHAMHVAVLLCHFANYLGMSETDCKRLAMLGLFFDIGMIKVPKDIREKNDKLSLEERILIQKHADYSAQLLEPLHFDTELVLAIEQHHERLNGSGYPNNLIGEDIHKFARMLAIVDCYDAMTTDRPFQKKTNPAAALKEITNKENGLDQKLAIKFIRCIGVYPIGSLVILTNKRIALVTKASTKNALKPIVKAFYCIMENEYLEPKLIDLNDPECEVSVVKPTLPEHYSLDMTRVEF